MMLHLLGVDVKEVAAATQPEPPDELPNWLDDSNLLDSRELRRSVDGCRVRDRLLYVV
jgi:hypothetical protein